MSENPTWTGVTAQYPLYGGHVNQFTTGHTTLALWDGTLQANNVTNGAGTVGTNNLWLAQSFVTTANQSAIGYVFNPISTTTTTGASLAPTTLSVYANNGGQPDVASGPLVSVAVTAEYAYSTSGVISNNNSTYYPMPITGLAANSTYWLVLAPTSSVGQFTWFQSSATSGASTSTDGVTWTPQAYGLRYRIFDQTPTGLLRCTWEDGGSRWTAYTYNANNTPHFYSEYTAGQGGGLNYVQSNRTFNFTNNMLTTLT